MKLVDFILLKRNANEYIEILEKELIEQNIKSHVSHETIEFEFEKIKKPSKFYIGKQYTRKDLEIECQSFFEKNDLDMDIQTLDPHEFHEQMTKAKNRLSVRKHNRLKKINKKQI